MEQPSKAKKISSRKKNNILDQNLQKSPILHIIKVI